jgi:hypothetical protein
VARTVITTLCAALTRLSITVFWESFISSKLSSRSIANTEKERPAALQHSDNSKALFWTWVELAREKPPLLAY